MSDQQPQLPLDKQPEPVVDLTPFEQFIKHDKYKNQMSIGGTKLLESFLKAQTFMEDIHRKLLQQVDNRLHDNYGRISRTAHHQLAAIISRYLPKLQEQDPALAEQLQAAITEADLIEQLAEQKAEEVARTRTRGNIKFVDTLNLKRREPA